ncbi:hypothetical protein [Rubrivivax sp. A210]|uniref:hypothetical protein n=1 Tax=Rubrivivax sp. A210 TaxID=2772301 RepID=UPI00191B5CF6|nr:hypothetical protein [Rubrivivax sp. A210]
MEALQSLQIATLGVSLVGVGVSVAGFLYMRKRFDALDGRLQDLERTIHTGFEQQHMASLRRHFSRTKGLVQRAEQAASLSDPRSEYMQIAAALSDEASFFEGELDFTLKAQGPIDLALFWQLAQAWMLCNGFRIDCRIRANELRNALHVSEQVAADYQRRFDGITPVSFASSLDDGVATVKVLRDVTDAAASKPYLLDYLRTRRIDGPGYLDDLDRETERPLLILRAT